MSFDPEGDLYTAEPKLLSIDCFPFLFSRPAPPDYDLIMAATTRYQRVPEENRPSMDSSSGNEDHDVLLIDPYINDDGDTPPKKGHSFTCHPTVFFRLVSNCILIISLVLLIVGTRKSAIPAEVFICIVLVRNFLVILHHVFSKYILFRLEFRNRSPKAPKRRRCCRSWGKHGRLQLLLDLFLLICLIITVIVSTIPPGGYSWQYERTHAIVAGCVLAFIGILLYALSIPDLGQPSNITISWGITFSYAKSKHIDRREQPQVYRDVEATGGIGIQPRKTGADSPVVV